MVRLPASGRSLYRSAAAAPRRGKPFGRLRDAKSPLGSRLPRWRLVSPSAVDRHISGWVSVSLTKPYELGGWSAGASLRSARRTGVYPHLPGSGDYPDPAPGKPRHGQRNHGGSSSEAVASAPRDQWTRRGPPAALGHTRRSLMLIAGVKSKAARCRPQWERAVPQPQPRVAAFPSVHTAVGAPAYVSGLWPVVRRPSPCTAGSAGARTEPVLADRPDVRVTWAEC
jgi:hypothetical protein